MFLKMLPVLSLWYMLAIAATTTVPVQPSDASRVINSLRFAVVADMDKGTRGEKHWFHTVLKIGTLHALASSQNNSANVSHGTPQFRIQWEQDIPLKSRFANKNRGLELSDLALWEGSLWSICDSTGILYELVPKRKANNNVDITGSETDKEPTCPGYLNADFIDLVPKLITTDDGGESMLPAKNEWLAVVRDKLYIGGAFFSHYQLFTERLDS